jgi:hypothetical protein
MECGFAGFHFGSLGVDDDIQDPVESGSFQENPQDK